MTKQVDFEKYKYFVDGVTSDPSKDGIAFIRRLQELEHDNDVHRLLTGAVGICAEGGEFMEIVKKMIFQGKPFNEDNVFHMKRELGDIMWYVAQVCMSLDVTLDEILEMNVYNLKSIYTGEEFYVHYSDNRKECDL